jgi:mono/diheme cytochrome c family protein
MMTMKSEGYESSCICLLVIIALFFSLYCVSASAAANDQSVRSVFSSTCASCHSQNGTPTAVGKSLNAPDLGSADVQSRTNAQLQEIISGGKGNMPPFKGTLSESQISSLVAYVRTFSRQRKHP